MNLALITAGGSGERMNQSVPKQFLNVFDKPIIIYTLEAFEKHPNIDAIVVACLYGWQDVLRAYADQFKIKKLKHIVAGGENGQGSIRNGLFELEKHYGEGDIVLVHDGNRPLVSEEIISESIATTHRYGSAVAAIPCQEAIFETDDRISAVRSYSRDSLCRTQTPHAFHLGELCAAHRAALERGITNSVASCTLMAALGKTIYFSPGSEKNIKLTTLEDIDIFKALLKARRNG